MVHRLSDLRDLDDSRHGEVPAELHQFDDMSDFSKLSRFDVRKGCSLKGTMMSSRTWRLDAPCATANSGSNLPPQGHLAASVDRNAETALPSTNPTIHPMVASLSCWFSAPRALSLPHNPATYVSGMTRRVAEDARVFQHIAGCAPHRHRRGGQHPQPAWGLSYLRTVIVTAAVYRRFGSELRFPKEANPSP
jgi:hypothetical protein